MGKPRIRKNNNKKFLEYFLELFTLITNAIDKKKRGQSAGSDFFKESIAKVKGEIMLVISTERELKKE